MKIKDIILEQNVKVIDRKIPIDNSTTFEHLKLLGKGAFAKVFQSGVNSNEVIKIVNVTGLHDSNVKFVETVLDNQDNPHLPRIYGAKLYPSSKSGYVLIVKMEKLVDIHNPKISHMLPVFMKQIGISENEILNAINDGKGDSTENISDLSSISKQQASELGDLLMYELTDPEIVRYYGKHMKNTKLGEAFLILYELAKSNPNIIVDLHEENVMVRLGNPPQLVITDPVFDDAW